MLERSNILLEEDVEVRYFKDMWTFMDSGVKADIIKVEYEDDEEDTGKDFVNHGEVMVALKTILIKENKEDSEMIVEVIDCLIEKIRMVKSKKELKKLRSMEAEKTLREKRQGSLKKRCIRDEEYLCTVNIVKTFVMGSIIDPCLDKRMMMLISITNYG